MSTNTRDASNADDLVELLKNDSKDAEQELAAFGGLKNIIRNLKTSKVKGIIATPQLLREKANRYGLNQLYEQDAMKSFFHYLVYSFLDVTLIILLIAAIVSVVLGAIYPEICQGKSISKDNDNAWKEGVGIMATILVIVLLSALSDYYRNKHLYKLHMNIENERKISVIRSGITVQIGYRDVRVGDLVVLETGSVVPADGILVENTEVTTDETSISRTDRAPKSKKDPFVFTSTHVIVGQGKMLVLAVGERTVAGKIAKKNKLENATKNLVLAGQSLQGKLTFASSILGILGIVVGIIVALVILISFLVKTYEVDNIAYEPSHWNEIIKAFIIGVVIIIVAEPEGLSLASTIAMISSMGSMQKKNIFIRNPDVLETMGNVTALCMKKHGVLTTVSKHVMREEIVESYIDGEHFRGDANDYKDKIPHNVCHDIGVGISVNTSYSTHFKYSGNVPSVVGDITEGALLEFVDDLDMSYRLIRRKYPEENHFKTFPFNPKEKYMTTVLKLNEETYQIYTKGAPEVILQRCTSILTSNGVKSIEPEERKRINELVNAMVRKSQLKVICLAQKMIRAEKTDASAWESNQVEKDYALVAIMGIEGTMGQEQSAETRMAVAAGRLFSKQQFGIQMPLTRYLKTANADLLEDFSRGVAINTSYLSDIKNEGDGKLSQHVGDPRDCALLQFVINIGFPYQFYRDEFPHQKHIEYKSSPLEDPSKQYTATVIKVPELNVYRVYVKGGINYVINHSKNTVPNHPDEKIELDDAAKQKFFTEYNDLQKRDMNVIAFGVKDIPAGNGPPDWNNREDIMSDLNFMGYLGLVEEESGEISDVISTFREAGMRVSLVTGGSIQSSGALAKNTGILSPTRDWPATKDSKGSVFGYDYKVFEKEVTGNNGINQQMFDKLWRNDELRVLASCPPVRSPELIKGIKESNVTESGEVVAAVASGIHDGPFLKEADVGISLGVSGANVAQESSDIILKEDKIQSLVETVKYGRHIYETVLKFLQFQLTATWVTLIVLIIGAILFQKSLFSATQLLWLNLIMDALASIALTGDQPTADILRHKPYGRNKPLISRAVLRNVILHSLYQIAIIFIIIYVFADFTDTRYGYGKVSICKPSQHATMVFTSFILMTLFNEINCRRVNDRNVFIFKGEKFNCAFFIILMVCFAIQILMVFFFYDAFRVREMDAEQWLWCIFFGFSELLWGQIVFTVPKWFVPGQIRCCKKGVPAQEAGCCRCVRGVRSRDEIDAPTEFFGIASQPSSRANVRNSSVNPMTVSS